MYKQLVVGKFVRALFINPSKYNLVNKFSNYNEIVDFFKLYDKNIKISKYSISKLKHRKQCFYIIPRIHYTLNFGVYINPKFPGIYENN